jgi:hypothetical protein
MFQNSSFRLSAIHFQPSSFSLPILVFSLQLCKTGHYLALAWPQFFQCNLYTFFKFALSDGRPDNVLVYRGSAPPKKRNIIQMFNFLFPLLIITWYCGAEISLNQNFTLVVFKSTAYRLGTSKFDVSVCVCICLWFQTLSESQIREVWLTNKLRMLWNVPEPCL